MKQATADGYTPAVVVPPLPHASHTGNTETEAEDGTTPVGKLSGASVPAFTDTGRASHEAAGTPAPLTAPAFPVTFAKAGSTSRVVTDEAQRLQAIEDGFSPTLSPTPSFPRIFSKAGNPDRIAHNDVEANQAVVDGFHAK